MVVGLARNEEVPQPQTKNYFPAPGYPSHGFSYEFIGDY